MSADWAMVIITGIYVIATIFICIFNGCSAKATRDQVRESQNQFTESKRLECLPFLQLEISQDASTPLFEIELPFYKESATDTIYTILWLKNLGNGTATNIIYSWQYKAWNVNTTGYPPINAVMRGDKYCFQITLDVDDNIDANPNKSLVFQFEDLLGNTYEQRIVLCFENREMIRCEGNPPRFLGQIAYSVVQNNVQQENTQESI